MTLTRSIVPLRALRNVMHEQESIISDPLGVENITFTGARNPVFK